MDVSVVIPTYNCADHIGRAVDSVLGQSVKPYEVLVVDDGSTDNTARILSSYGENIRYIRQDNAGASLARNSGIEAASGEWIAFLDADDQWLPKYLQAQVDLLERNPELVWTTGNFIHCRCDQDHHQFENFDPSKAVEILDGKDFFDDYFTGLNRVGGGCTDTVVIRKDALQQAGMFRPGQRVANDLDMWWRIAYLFPKIGYSPCPLAVYHRKIEGSITKINTNPDLIIDLVEKHLKLASEKGRMDAFGPFVRHYLKYWIHQYMLDERIYAVRTVIKKFGGLLGLSYTMTLKILTVSPKLTSAFLPFLRKINKIMRLKI